MSDSAQVLACIDVKPDDAAAHAHALRAMLIDRAVIVAEESDCALGEPGHEPGRGALSVLENAAPEDVWSNGRLLVDGVAFLVGRQVFDTGGNGVELRCAACNGTNEGSDAYFDAISQWCAGDDGVTVPCPLCGSEQLLTEWDGPCSYAFGHLGLAFWNWSPLRQSFIDEIAALTRSRVRHLWQRI